MGLRRTAAVRVAPHPALRATFSPQAGRRDSSSSRGRCGNARRPPARDRPRRRGTPCATASSRDIRAAAPFSAASISTRVRRPSQTISRPATRDRRRRLGLRRGRRHFARVASSAPTARNGARTRCWPPSPNARATPAGGSTCIVSRRAISAPAARSCFGLVDEADMGRDDPPELGKANPGLHLPPDLARRAVAPKQRRRD